MTTPFRYYVELRNSSGTTLSTHAIAHSSYAAITVAVVMFANCPQIATTISKQSPGILSRSTLCVFALVA
jgi:hypothetical protein